MTKAFDAEAHLDHMANVMGLTIAPEWRESVIANVKATEAIAQAVLSFHLTDHDEPAPVFEP